MNASSFTHLGRYRIVRELGRGAMGIVHLAQDEALQRPVALKTLVLPDAPQEARELEARFRQEAKAAGALNHPNTITVYDFGREGNRLYIALELLEGVELRERLQHGPLPLDEALDIAAQVASGLAAAHARGVVHRDVKPANIMVLPGGLAKIMDFGIARVQASELRTATGTMLGSPRYMSPEQVGGHPVDHRSDIFSLGSVLYEMVTGRPPFEGANLGVLLGAIQHGATVPPTQVQPGLPASVELVIVRALQKNPEVRYQDAAEMARDLVQCRAALARARGLALSAPPDIDLTAPATAPAALEAEGATPALSASDAGGPWPLAPAFDPAAGLRWLAQGERAPAAAAGPSWAGTLWVCAWLVAAAAALLLAFG
jgi:eukaryotic-like serine/threonine-protein kinase